MRSYIKVIVPWVVEGGKIVVIATGAAANIIAAGVVAIGGAITVWLINRKQQLPPPS